MNELNKNKEQHKVYETRIAGLMENLRDEKNYNKSIFVKEQVA